MCRLVVFGALPQFLPGWWWDQRRLLLPKNGLTSPAVPFRNEQTRRNRRCTAVLELIPRQPWWRLADFVLKDGMLSATEETIGFEKRHHHDWFDENDVEISELLTKKNKAYAAWLADPKSDYKREHFADLRKTAQIHLRRIQKMTGGGRRQMNCNNMPTNMTARASKTLWRKCTAQNMHPYHL